MSLDALAPDQRAVVQLVLQQDRSYEDLAALLGITPEAVRERAHRGMERLAPGEALDPDDRAQISDYLLGQQSVSGREGTRSLLSGSQPARSWAVAVATQLADVARGALPEIPSGPAAAPAARPEPTEPVVAGDSDPMLEDPVTPTAVSEPVAPTRARPRPRQRTQETVPADFGFSDAAGDDPKQADGDPDPGETAKTSRLGGALLIAGLAIFVTALIVWLVSRDDNSGTKNATSPTATAEASPTAAGTADYQPVAVLKLRPTDGGEAAGNAVIFVSATNEVAFNLEASNVPARGENEAYGVWVTGGPESHFLGYAPPVGEDGNLATSGPRTQDAANFAAWLSDPGAKIVVSVETEEGATEPGPIVLQGSVKKAQAVGSPTPTATP